MSKPPLEDAHCLMPDELAAAVPRLYDTQDDADPVAHVKLFTPDSSWTWWITEYDPEQRLCFGLVKGLETEFGYFTLAELEEVRGPNGLKIERDLYFQPAPVSQCDTSGGAS